MSSPSHREAKCGVMSAFSTVKALYLKKSRFFIDVAVVLPLALVLFVAGARLDIFDSTIHAWVTRSEIAGELLGGVLFLAFGFVYFAIRRRQDMQDEIRRGSAAEQSLLACQGPLERQVAQRADDLVQANEMLLAQIQRREAVEAEMQRNLERIRALHEIDLAITSTLDLSGVLKVLLEKIDVFLPHDAATVRFYNPEKRQLEVVGSRNVDEEAWKKHLAHHDHGPGYAWRIFNSGKPLAIGDFQTEPAVDGPSFLVEQGFTSLLGVPLKAGSEAIGVLTLYSRDKRIFTEREIEFLHTVGGQAAIAMNNARLYERIERAQRIKDEFLSVMSHELRTPLSVIVGYVGMVKDGVFGPVNERQQAALDKTIRRAGDQLCMINDILQTAQLEARMSSVERLPFDVGQLLEQLGSDYAGRAKSDGTEIVFECGETPLIVTSDAAKVKQILQNLIGNALKFTSRGTIRVAARTIVAARAESGAAHGHGHAIAAPRSAERVEIAVADSGCGIPPEKLETIFEKFRQLDASETRLYGGVGLGLYIAKKFADLIGATLAVQSELGKGSTFTLTLPVD